MNIENNYGSESLIGKNNKDDLANEED